MIEIDFLIVGQGLSGSLLAWELLQTQQKILIIDDGQINASKVAAGLINPVTGLRFVKSDQIESLLPYAKSFYAQLGRVFQQPFFIETPMLRILRSEKEVIAGKKRLQQQAYENYLEAIKPAPNYIKSSFGVIQQKQTGYLLTENLLNALKNYFISLAAYQADQFDYDLLIPDISLKWKQIQCKKVIFCEGHHARYNPWFSWLPFQPVKGEIITAESKNELPDEILNFGHWLMPLDSGQFRLGATYDRDHLNLEPTEASKKQLFDSAKRYFPGLNINKINKHQAGIRPTTLDKQPFIGQHPKYHDLLIFNGFGSRGSLQIPWYCHRLVEYLINDQPLPESCDIQRYQSKYD